jgi:biotin synthase
VAEAYGFAATAEDYRATYRMLRKHVRVVPHITIGLRGGRISGERAALEVLREEGAESIVFLVLIPTPGTRYAGCAPPPVEDVARLLAEARLAFPETPLLLGCMRPAGSYRQALDPLAVRAGINRMVKPSRLTLEYARGLGLMTEIGQECCVFGSTPPAGPTPVPSRPGEAEGAEGQGEGRVRVSAGSEVLLGLRSRPMQASPTTAYLMLDGGGCAMPCSFCAQSRGSQARADALSRVVWPAYPAATVWDALRDDRAGAPAALARVCFQVTAHRGALEGVLAAVEQVRQVTSRPISVAIRPAGLEGVAALLDAGVDAVGLGLDCAQEAVYRAVKGAGWHKMIALVEEACRRFARRIRVHLMVGLGETEEELCRMLGKIYSWGGSVGLFAFTPVRGTPLQGRPQPALDVYRRMQVARFLIHGGHARSDRFVFDTAGRLSSFGTADLPALLADGEAFRTSGCPGCNRPFYNERPGGVLYNYPQQLSPAEVGRSLQELRLGPPSGSLGGTR